MKSIRRNEVSLIFVVVLAFMSINSVRSEYTWNGSEWVWSEASSDTKEQDVQDSNYGYEGSGGGGYYDEDMNDNFDDENNVEEGSGGPYVEKEQFNNNNQQIDYNRNQGSIYNNNQEIYSNGNNGFNQDNNKNNNGYNQNNVDGGGGWQDNNSPYDIYAPSTKAPSYYNPEKTGGDDIYVDPPTTTTTTVAPRDPSRRPKNASRPTSFFAQPGTLAAVIGGAVVGLLCAILCVMFVVYRMRKKDEGSYALDEPKRSPTVNAYAKHPSREFYA